MALILERRTYPAGEEVLTIADRSFRFVEFGGKELRRYAVRIKLAYDRARDKIAELDQVDLDRVGEIVLDEEDELFVSLLTSARLEGEELTAEWVSDEVTYSMRVHLLEQLNKLNAIEEQLGNWLRLREEAAVQKVSLATSGEPSKSSSISSAPATV